MLAAKVMRWNSYCVCSVEPIVRSVGLQSGCFLEAANPPSSPPHSFSYPILTSLFSLLGIYSNKTVLFRATGSPLVVSKIRLNPAISILRTISLRSNHFYHEDERRKAIRNFGFHLPDITMSHSRRQFILCHIHPVLGNGHGTTNYTPALTKWWLCKRLLIGKWRKQQRNGVPYAVRLRNGVFCVVRAEIS
jgi:hypothetical protein